MRLLSWIRAHGPGSRVRLEQTARWLAMRYAPLVQEHLAALGHDGMSSWEARGYVRSWAELVMDRVVASAAPPAPFTWDRVRPLVVSRIVQQLAPALAGPGAQQHRQAA